MCLADSFQETQPVFSGDLYRSAAVLFQHRPLFKTAEDCFRPLLAEGGVCLGKVLRNIMLLYAHTAHCFTSSAQQMQSRFGPCLHYSPVQSIYCIFFLFQSLKVKRAVGTEIFRISFSFLCHTESQEDGPTRSGGEQVYEGRGMYICHAEETKIATSFPTQKIQKYTHTQIYAHIGTYFYFSTVFT